MILFRTIVLLYCVVVCSSDAGFFWHVTDFHWDFSYWTDQLSCNGMNVTGAGNYGNEWCDSPWALVQEAVGKMGLTRPDVDFVLWTGDTVPHVSGDHLSVEINQELVRNVTSLMASAFPTKKVYATFGNHDYFPNGLFPPHNNEIYNATYELWRAWINDASQEANFHKGGYYTVSLGGGLRLLALNSNMYYTKDTVTKDIPDPADQFQWMDQTLTEAASNSEKVIVVGHVPPGFTTPRALRWMTKAFNERFVELVLKHARTIAALHFGHEHHDSFRLFYDDSTTTGVNKASMFIAPSVTPWRYQLPNGEVEPAHNPGVRLVKYDRQTGVTLDIIQYYADLDAVNANNHFEWIEGYSATAMYSVPDLSNDSMEKVLGKLANFSSNEFQDFVKWYNTAGDNHANLCQRDCHHVVMCGLRHMTERPFNACLHGPTNSFRPLCPTILMLLVLLAHILK